MTLSRHPCCRCNCVISSHLIHTYSLSTRTHTRCTARVPVCVVLLVLLPCVSVPLSSVTARLLTSGMSAVGAPSSASGPAMARKAIQQLAIELTPALLLLVLHQLLTAVAVCVCVCLCAVSVCSRRSIHSQRSAGRCSSFCATPPHLSALHSFLSPSLPPPSCSERSVQAVTDRVMVVDSLSVCLCGRVSLSDASAMSLFPLCQ